jgi:serine/threonine-protein kinase
MLGPEAQGIVAYMSPEQALGGLVDPRSDVFSLGVIAYEMLAGVHPFAQPSVADTLVRITGGTLAPPSTSNPDVTPEFDALVMRALAKDIEQRQQSAASFSAELRSLGAMLDVRTGDSPSPGDLLPIDDDPGMAKWWAVAAAGLLIGAAAWWFFARP